MPVVAVGPVNRLLVLAVLVVEARVLPAQLQLLGLLTLVVVVVRLLVLQRQAVPASSSFYLDRKIMGHFARIDDANIVREVISVANAAMDDKPFPESEPIGQAMLAESGFTGTWLQCSYNANFRACYPGTGYTYDQTLDVFVPPAQPEPES